MDDFLQNDVQNTPPPDGPFVLAKTLKSKVKAVRKPKPQPTGLEIDEETWLALNDVSLELYREKAQLSSLGLNSNTSKITIRSVLATHFADEYSMYLFSISSIFRSLLIVHLKTFFARMELLYVAIFLGRIGLRVQLQVELP